MHGGMHRVCTASSQTEFNSEKGNGSNPEVIDNNSFSSMESHQIYKAHLRAPPPHAQEQMANTQTQNLIFYLLFVCSFVPYCFVRAPFILVVFFLHIISSDSMFLWILFVCVCFLCPVNVFLSFHISVCLSLFWFVFSRVVSVCCYCCLQFNSQNRPKSLIVEAGIHYPIPPGQPGQR